jgi:hypothetical protein
MMDLADFDEIEIRVALFLSVSVAVAQNNSETGCFVHTKSPEKTKICIVI